MSTPLHALGLVALGGALIIAAAPAAAYTFYESDAGAPMRWYRDALTYRISTVEPEEVDRDVLPELVEAAFGRWIDLPGCLTPEVTYAGDTDATERTSPSTVADPPDNVVVFIPDKQVWAAGSRSSTWIGITTIAHDTLTGEIVDADIEINDGHYTFSNSGAPAGHEIDLLSMLVHEAGHFMGLDHTAVSHATMFANYQSSDPIAARDLVEDDKAGACALYDVRAPGQVSIGDGEILTRVTDVSEGDRCARGGARVDLAVDVDGDGEVDDGEVVETRVICYRDGEVGADVRVTREALTHGCKTDGVRVRLAFGDLAGDPLEVTDARDTVFLCRGGENPGGGGGGGCQAAGSTSWGWVLALAGGAWLLWRRRRVERATC